MSCVHSLHFTTPAKFIRSFFDSVIHVKVGTEEKDYGIHKSLLFQVSRFFKAALSGKFYEARSGVVVLADENPKVFDRFNAWLYTGSLLLDGENLKSLPHSIIFDIYAFAERRIIPSLQNKAIDTVIEVYLTTKRVPLKSMARSWPTLSETSLLRGFLIDFYAMNVDLEKYFVEPKLRTLGLEFVAEVAKRCSKRSKRRISSTNMWARRCDWHVHEAGEFCIRTKS